MVMLRFRVWIKMKRTLLVRGAVKGLPKEVDCYQKASALSIFSSEN